MPFQMSYNRAELSGKSAVPPGWYHIQFIQFRPKVAKSDPNSFNYNAEFEIVNHPEYEGRRVFVTFSNKFVAQLQAWVHACNMEFEEIKDGNEGTEAAGHKLPGTLIGFKEYPNEPEKWSYQGPLKNAICKAELFIDDQGNNKPKQFECRIDGCRVKHPTNMT